MRLRQLALGFALLSVAVPAFSAEGQSGRCIGVGCPALLESFWWRVYVGKEPHVSVTRMTGHDGDIDLADLPSDVWEIGGVYPFQTSAVACEVVSNDADDTAAGAGARTVEITGLDANYAQIRETLTLNGVTPVATVRTYLRINDFRVVTAGSSGSNEGLVDFRVIAGSVVLSRIDNNGGLFGDGIAHTGVYTVPAGFKWLPYYFSATTLKPQVDNVHLSLRYRPFGGAWFTRNQWGMNSQGSGYVTFDPPAAVAVPPKTDVRFTVHGLTTNNMGVSLALLSLLVPETY